tara:strand:- start:22 stop:2100 length:2079 start_codon:yes stop_codon:yes gene_type:complete
MALNEQTEMAFRDRPTRVDPVSGNEVPPGALPSEVRDDIPARLSEGEYVVPADVLQYYGIKFFEDLRNKAKTELAGLEENNRIGGEPVGDNINFPFSVDELNVYEDDTPVAANMGGMIRGYQEGGITDAVLPGTNESIIKTFINDAGQRLFIRFLNGIAIPPVPPGYTEEGVATTTPVVATSTETQADEETGGEPEVFARDLEKMNAAQLAQFAAEIAKTPIYNAVSNSKIAIFLGSKRQEKKVIDYLTEKTEATSTDPNMKSFYQDLLDGIEGGKRDELIALADNLANNTLNLNKKVLVSGSTITADKKTKGNGNAVGLSGTKYFKDRFKTGALDSAVSDALAGTTSTVTVPGVLSGKFDSANEFAFDTPVTTAATITDATRDRMRNENALMSKTLPRITTESLPALPERNPEGVFSPSPVSTSDGRRDSLRDAAEREQLAQIQRDRQSLASSLKSDRLRDSMRNENVLLPPEKDKIDPTSLNYDPAFQYMGGSGMTLEERLKDAVPDNPFNFYDLETNQTNNISNIVKLAEANPTKVNNILSTVELAVNAQDDDAVKAGLVPNVYTAQLRNSLYSTYENPRTYEQEIIGGPVSATPSTVLPGYFEGDSGSDPRITDTDVGEPTPADEFVGSLPKEEDNEDSSNAGDFTGGRTNRGSGSTAGGFGGTGRGRSGYNTGGLASKRKTKKRKSK